ncbi:MAG: DUF835 domain-containing protein [Methanomassiliicoccales archaeon]
MKLDSGKMVLIEERVPLRTHQLLRRELASGRKALYISKHSPSLLESQFDTVKENMQTRWLSPRPDGNCIPPMNLMRFEADVQSFFEHNHDGIVVLNGVDVLEMWNGFRPVLEIMKRTRKRAGAQEGNFVISLDPKDYYDGELKALRMISDEVVLAPA